MIHLVVPAYNEEPNIATLFERLRPVARELDASVVVVDDGSTDRTVELVRAHSGDLRVRIAEHGTNRGLGAAVNTGLRLALADAADDDAIVTLEADTTSDLRTLPAMLALFDEGCDVVLASVHAPGGRIIGVAPWRIVASKGVSAVFRHTCGLREIHTVSGLYRVYRAGALRRAAARYGSQLLRQNGFAVNVELLLKLRSAGARVAEVATTNDWTSRGGTSKLKARATLQAYGRVLFEHIADRVQPPPLATLEPRQ